MFPNKNYRYFYFKNGDAVAQVNRVLALGGRVPDGGPDAFIADLLLRGSVAEAFVAGFAERNQVNKQGFLRTRTFSTRGLVNKLSALFALPASILAYRPHRILCGRHGYALLMCLFAGRLLGVPVVFSAHTGLSGWAKGISGFIRKWLDPWLFRRCDAAICHGPYLARELAKVGLRPEQIITFDSGCADLLPATGDSPMQPTAPPQILYVGRIVREKGVFDLLDAFHSIVATSRLAHLVYAGDGSDREALFRRTEELGLVDCVHFHGAVPRHEIGALIGRAWVVVTPTRSECPEGRCMAAMEGLAMGVPVVAPDAGPFPYLVRDGDNGLLFEQDSMDALVGALCRLLDDETLRERFSSTAIRERKALLEPELGFADAVDQAFSLGRT